MKSNSQKVLNCDGHGNEHKKLFYPSLFSQNEQKIFVSIYEFPMYCLPLGRTGLGPQSCVSGLI